MALGAVLVDKARLIEKRASSQRVEGTSRMTTVHGPWFKARLILPAGQQDNTPGDAPLMRGIAKGRVRSLLSGQLMWALKDENGDLVDVRFDHRVEVVSKELGSGIYLISGDPEKMRKKRSVIGHLATIERAEEREFEELSA